MSTGSAGRPWGSISLSVYKASNLNNQNTLVFDVSNLFSGNNFIADNRIVIPSYKYFNTSFSYLFKVKICNFINTCGSTEVNVFIENDRIPYVSIHGPSKLLMGAKDVLYLTGTVPVANEDSPLSFCVSRTIGDLEFQWTVYQNNNIENTNIKSVSKQRNKFILPPFSLSPNTLYQIKYTIFDKKHQEISSASINILIATSRVVAVIMGGSERIISPNIDYTFNASSSLGDKNYLEYFWTCSQILPIYQSTCNFDLSYPTASQAVAIIKVGQSFIGYKFTLTLLVTDTKTKVYDSTSLTVEVKS
jgi:hypothetical protein